MLVLVLVFEDSWFAGSDEAAGSADSDGCSAVWVSVVVGVVSISSVMAAAASTDSDSDSDIVL